MIDRQKIQDAVLEEVPLAAWKTIRVTIDKTLEAIGNANLHFDIYDLQRVVNNMVVEYESNDSISEKCKIEFDSDGITIHQLRNDSKCESTWVHVDFLN